MQRRYALILWLTSTSLALAQTTTVLPPVDVTAPPLDDTTPSSPTQRDSSATVSVVTPKAGEHKDASELIGSTPGVAILDAGGAGQRKTLTLRGSSPNGVMVMLDGVPLTTAGNAMDLSRIPTAALDRIEILRGAGANRYGPGTLGGVVQLVSKNPQGTTAFAEVSQGSFATTRLTAGATTPVLGGNGLVLLHGLYTQGNFQVRYDDKPELDGNAPLLLERENNDALNGGGLLRFRRKFGRTSLDALVEGFAESRGLAGVIANPTLDAKQRGARGTASARLTHDFEAGGQLAGLAWARVDSSQLRGSLFGDQLFTQLESAVGAELVYTRLFGTRHGLTALISGGGEFLREPTGLNPRWGRFGAMAQDEVFFFEGLFAVNGSVRVDVAGPFVVVSPKLGAALFLPKGFEVKANAGQTSRPPTFAELYVVQGTLLPNAELRPERSLVADLGVGWKFKKLVSATVTGFASLTEDLIIYEFSPPRMAKPFNFQAASVVGVEVEAKTNPLRWLEAGASYTWMTTSNLKDDARYYLKSLPYRPQHRLHARVVAGVPMLSARAELLFQSHQYTNRTETTVLPARAFLNVGVSSTPLESIPLTLAFDVKNVLDTQSQDIDGYPLPPRAAFVSLAIAWDFTKKASP